MAAELTCARRRKIVEENGDYILLGKENKEKEKRKPRSNSTQAQGG